jgi:hypothetical protein
MAPSDLPATSPRLLSFRPFARASTLVALLLSGLAWALLESNPASPSSARLASALLTRQLGLTDLVLVTEARYLRHLALADRHSAFQDHPLALEHFPSGAVLGVPAHLRVPDASIAPDARPTESTRTAR